MAKSKETFSKKEKEKKRLKKRQDKEAKMEERKSGSKDSSLESMLAYVDEDGNLSDTPPDPKTRREISLDEIQLGAADKRDEASMVPHTGKIESFFHDKGFGFIKDAANGKSIFVHVSAMDSSIDVGDMVSFEVEQTVKGLSASNVVKI